MQESKLVSGRKIKNRFSVVKICLSLIILMIGIFYINKNIYADDIGVPENISIEIGKMEYKTYFFTGDNCKNIEFRKQLDSNDQKVKIRVTNKQVGDRYAYYTVQYFGYEEGNVYVYPYDVDTGTTWNGYQIHIQAPQIDIDSCNGKEIEFSFYSFSDENINIGYTASVYHGNGLQYTKTIESGYSDQSDPFNADKVIWRYRYDCKLTLYTNGTYKALLYNDDTKTRLWIDLNIHDHVAKEFQKENIVEPTCGIAGSYDIVARCEKCDTIISSTTEKIEPTGNHTIVSDTAIEPTCTENGKTEGSHCSVCGQILQKQRTIPATGHQYGDYAIMQYPTCTSSGYKVRECIICGETDTEVIEALGHKEVIDAEIPATCTEEGETEGSHCERCGKVLRRQESIPTTNHKWSDWKVIKESTCTDKGSKTRVCSACGVTENIDIEATGHAWEDKYTIDKEATCTTDG